VNRAGNVGIGTTTPAHRLSLVGGPAWTSNQFTGALELGNAAAIGWQTDAGGQHFGIGQSTGGLYFFHTTSNPGTTGSPANFDFQIADNGNVIQPINNNGLVKAMIIVNGNSSSGASIAQCYNGKTNSSSGGCGFTLTEPLGVANGVYRINFNFPVSSRFVSVTAEYDSTGTFFGHYNAGANYRMFDSTSVEVFTFDSGNSDDTTGATFTLILY
jgi:hypothetical protein